MRVLYVIFVLCVSALLWAVVAIARHVRRHDEKPESGAAERIPPLRTVDKPSENSDAVLGVKKIHGD